MEKKNGNYHLVLRLSRGNGEENRNYYSIYPQIMTPKMGLDPSETQRHPQVEQPGGSSSASAGTLGLWDSEGRKLKEEEKNKNIKLQDYINMY